MKDSNVEKVIGQLREREARGLQKYGTNTDRPDLSTLEWLQHLQEELMDASVYIEKLKNEMKETQYYKLIESTIFQYYTLSFQIEENEKIKTP